MTRHYPDLGSASDWLNQISHAARPIRSTTQIWVVTRHQYGISALVSQTSFRGETSGGVVICRLFSQAKATARLVIVLIIRIQMSGTGMGTTILRAKEEISRKLELKFPV